MNKIIEIEHKIDLDDIAYNLDSEQKEYLIDALLDDLDDSRKSDMLTRHLDDVCHSEMITYLRNEGYTVEE